MNHRFLLIISFVLMLVSCRGKNENGVVNPPKNLGSGDSAIHGPNNVPKNPFPDFDKKNIKKTKKLENGISVAWIESKVTTNPTLKDGEMCLISYRLTLNNGKIIDGNNRIKSPYIPFIVGYNMQTKGWDIGMKELRVGDFAKISIPSGLAYGKNGIRGAIPPNAEVWLYVKILAKLSPDYERNGSKIWIFNKGKPGPLDQASNKEISYHCIASSKSNAKIQNTFVNNHPLSFIPGQLSVVPGLRSVLSNARSDEKIFALLPPNEAFGNIGLGNLVLPNETVLFILSIASVREL